MSENKIEESGLRRILRKTGKFLLVILCILISFIVISVVLMQFRSVRHFALNKVLKSVTAKTHSIITADDLHFYFTGHVDLDKLFVADQNSDTILFADNISVNINLKELLSGNIDIQNVGLSGTVAKVLKTDSIFNFSFLIDSLTSDNPDPDTIEVRKSTFNIDEIEMNNCRLSFKDANAGSDIAMAFTKMEVDVNSMDLDSLNFKLNSFLIDNGNIEIKTLPGTPAEETSEVALLPVILIEKTEMNNFSLTMSNKIDSQNVQFRTVRSELSDLSVNLNGNYITASQLKSKSSKVYLDSERTKIVVEKIADSLVVLPHINIGELVFSDNEIRMTDASNKKEVRKFDATNLLLKDLNGKISQFTFSNDSLFATASDITALLDDNRNIEVSGTIRKTKKSISVAGLDFLSGQTVIKGDVMAAFTEVNEKTVLTNSAIDLRNVTLYHNDVVYFIPDSIEKKYLTKQLPVIRLSAKAQGNLNRMEVSRLDFMAGNNTTLEAEFTLTDIEKPDAMSFDIPALSLKTSASDLQLIPVPGLIPSNINVPDFISVKARAKGMMKKFDLNSVVNTSIGNVDMYISMKQKNTFAGNIDIDKFNVGRLLKMEDQVGAVTMAIEFNGSGTTADDIKSDLHIKAPSIVYNKYEYNDLSIDGRMEGRAFSGIIELKDTNAELKIDGKFDLTAGREMVKAQIDIAGVNLQKMNFTKENIRFSSNATVDFKGLKYDSLAGKLSVNNIIIVKNEKIYLLDSLFLASVNDSTGYNAKMESSILNAEFKGAFAPVYVVPEIRNLINRYFPISDSVLTGERNDFSFDVSLRNHPVIKDVFLPDLEEFSTIEFKGNFDKKADVFNASLDVPYLRYAGMKLENFKGVIVSDSSALNAGIAFKEISNEQLKVDSLDFNAVLQDSTATITMVNLSDEEETKLALSSKIIAASANDYLLLLPKTFILNSAEWNTTGSDSIHLRKDLPVTLNVDLAKQDEHIQITRDETGNGKVSFKAFQIVNIFQLISRDSSLAAGSLDGDIILAEKSLSGNLYLNDLKVRRYTIGDLYLEAKQLPEGFTFKSTLDGNENNAEFTGSVLSENEVSRLDINGDIKSFSMKSIEGLTMGNLSSSSGYISGNFKVAGVSTDPAIDGKLVFNDVVTVPTAINSKFNIPKSTIEISNKKLVLDHFTMRDSEGKLLVVDGSIDLKNMLNPGIAINISSDEFELFNSPKARKKMFYGRMIADSKIDITGSSNSPVIKARLGIKKGTDFTFSIPESSSQSDRGSNEVVFKRDKLNEILTEGNISETGNSDVRNFNVESLLEIDKGAILRILPDPNSGDSLIVQGAAALNFGLDKTGRMSLTGSYELQDGSYVVSLENLVKKRFEIQQGSRIDWNGDPLTATVDLKAMLEVRTTPADLLANEFSTNQNLSQYKERLPFQVFLFLKGDLKAPVISFEIQLPAGSRGALGGMVNEKLILLNNDPSELNKQVFALLVLNRFIQEDPLASSTSGSAAENAARSSVSRFLSNQLNKLSSQFISGFELNFDLQSYNDYGTNSGEGRTELEVGIKKNINDRISVEVGGTVEVEGARAKENSLSDLTGDFAVEYKLTEEGEYRLKGFRRNQYEGLVEGQIVETGIGFMFVKDFDLWKDIFKTNTEEKK